MGRSYLTEARGNTKGLLGGHAELVEAYHFCPFTGSWRHTGPGMAGAWPGIHTSKKKKVIA